MTSDQTPMTFQVGIVGSDGVLLASDQKQIAEHVGIASGQYIHKIMVKETIACCASGGDVAQYAAELCLNTKLGCNSIEVHMLFCAKKAIRAYRERFRSNPERNGGVILLATDGDRGVMLYKLEMRQREARLPCRIPSGCVISGDELNAAIWFTDRYGPGSRCYPIADYCFLAAHTVLSAGRLNPRGVEGLEIVLCRHGAFERIDDEEIQRLAQRSELLDNGVSQQFRPSN
jgi:hypothetical protein